MGLTYLTPVEQLGKNFDAALPMPVIVFVKLRNALLVGAMDAAR